MSEGMDLSHYIPRRLDGGVRFLFWEIDVAMIGLMGALVGVGSSLPVIGLFLGIGAAFLYGKLKIGKHPGMATHFLH